MGAATLDVGLVRAKVARLSVTGELGYEINCRALEHAALRRTLLEAGRDLGVKEYGYNALLSLRLEKSFGIWSAEFTQDRTPRMTGMDRWIAWDKGDFLGRKAALAESKGPPPERQLVTLEIDAIDADATGYEPVWRSGAMVGFVTSGGYGHTVERAWRWPWLRRKPPRSAPSSACISSAPNAKRASLRPRHTIPRARRCGRERPAAS